MPEGMFSLQQQTSIDNNFPRLQSFRLLVDWNSSDIVHIEVFANAGFSDWS